MAFLNSSKPIGSMPYYPSDVGLKSLGKIARLAVRVAKAQRRCGVAVVERGGVVKLSHEYTRE
jgi:hypothetical protein